MQGNDFIILDNRRIIRKSTILDVVREHDKSVINTDKYIYRVNESLESILEKLNAR